MADRWLTLNEASVRVGRSERTLRRWWPTMKTLAGRVRESELLAQDRSMRAAVGRPRSVPGTPDG